MDLIKRLYKILILELIVFETIYPQISISISLYDENDTVLKLTEDNFGHYIYHQNHITLVEFYVHWCGHCIAFSPIWKQFAHNIKSWQTIVRLAAINCADDMEVCQRHGINAFPAVRIFGINAQSNELGSVLELHNQTVVALRTALVDFLLESQKSFSNRLNLFPLKVVSKKELFNALPIHLGKHNFIFLEKKLTHLGVELILDFSSHTENIVIHRVRDKTGSLADNLFTYDISLPSLIQIHRNQRLQFIASANSEDEQSLRKEFVSAIKKLLPVDDWTTTPFIFGEKVVTSDSASVNTSNVQNLNIKVNATKSKPPLSMTDLYNTIRYSFHNEITRFEVLNESQIVVLKNYTSIIYKYFPFDNENVRRFFKRINHWLTNKSTNLRAVDLKAAMKISDGYLPPIVDYKHCNGSKPHLRGYPCGLWSLFHTMTVNEYTASEENKHQVLHTMRDFIIHFFSCETCAKHFAEISQQLDSQLIDRQSSVLWLWRIHNQVNRRLKGALSEDPYYPKVEYPTQAMCQNCYKSKSEFDEEKVLKFLIQTYDERKFTKSNATKYNSSITLIYLNFIVLLYSIISSTF